MRQTNDFVLRGYESHLAGWYVGPGQVQLGNIPNLGNAPTWWLAQYPSRANTVLRAILPWVVIYDGTNNYATNTRLHFRNFRLYIKSRSTGQWALVGSTPGISGYNTPKTTLFAGSEPEDKRTNADGSVEIKPPSNANLAWHGWWNAGRASIDPNDVAAVHATIESRLTVDNPSLPDDRSTSQLGFHVGVDYYIDPNTSWDIIVPGAGVSRVKRVTSNWQAYSFTTFSDVGVQDQGGGITEAQFRAAPPPIF